MKKVIAYTLLLLLAFAAVASAFPAFREVRASHSRSDVLILDRHGEIVHEVRVDPKGRRLDWIGLKEVSPSLVKAVLQSEDRRFYEHSGVDWKAVGAAAFGRILGSGTRGASTVTMQLVVMLKKGEARSRHKTLRQKWNQMQEARELEKSWKKEEILEAYLNLVTFRGELQGLAAASGGLFRKHPSGLNLPESCILAALIRSPNARPEEVGKRAAVLFGSISAGQKTQGLEKETKELLCRPYRLRPSMALAPHAARRILAGKTGSEIAKSGTRQVSSTLDLRLQRFVQETVLQQLEALQGRNVGEGAVIVIDNRSGNILAYVGGTGESQVDGITARRQAGSTLKPFLYGLAIERRLLTAASILDDSPIHIPTDRGLYVPHDYDNRPHGPVTVRTALSSSLNIPAVRVQLLAGTEPFAERLRRFGFGLNRTAEFYGFSLALGTADVSLEELANAYRAIARGGVWSGLRLSPGKPGRRAKVMSSGAAYIIGDILADRSSRSLTFGMDNPLVTRFWTAVKTGTSKDMRDNWCIGFSRRYTVGVWVGNFSGDPMWNVSGISGAAPIWLEVMNYLHGDGRSAPPPRPKGIVAAQAAPEAGGTELFLAGTEPAAAAGFSGTPEPWRIPRIAYPPAGTIIVIDPDIPRENQVVFFEAENAPGADIRWKLNGEALPAGEEGRRWAPRPGRQELEMIGAGDKTLDRVSFEVRGSFPTGEPVVTATH